MNNHTWTKIGSLGHGKSCTFCGPNEGSLVFIRDLRFLPYPFGDERKAGRYVIGIIICSTLSQDCGSILRRGNVIARGGTIACHMIIKPHRLGRWLGL